MKIKKFNEHSHSEEESQLMSTYRLAEMVIKNMDLPDEYYTDEEKFLRFAKVLNEKMYENASDLFSKNAGGAPDERV